MDRVTHAGAMARQRSDIAKLVIAAVLLTLGVNLVTAPVLTSFSTLAVITVVCGITLILGSVLFASMQAVRAANYHANIKSILFLDGENRDPVAIDQYKFSEETADFLKSLFAENAAYRRTWKGQSSAKTPMAPSKPDEGLVLELVEYYFLKQLSHHLSETFNRIDSEKNRVVTFTRSDIPKILLSNRFLETFSRDMSERDAFSHHSHSKSAANEPKGKVVAAWGKGGELFDAFNLVLPKGSVLSRANSGSLIIETKKFRLSFRSKFRGFYGSTPFGFEALYLGVDFDQYDKRSIYSEVSLEYKFAAILSIFDWRYFQWVESFIDRIERNMSFDRFVLESGWKTAYTSSRLLSAEKSKWEIYRAVRSKKLASSEAKAGSGKPSKARGKR